MPEAYAENLDRVGTHGRQLGNITDAMIVLLRHLPHRANVPPEESKAIEALEKDGYQRRSERNLRR